MKTNIIKFRHRYYKLAQKEFTTIRGAAQYKRLHVGHVLRVETPDGDFDARIVGLALERAGALPLEFLKADAEYPGFVIRSPPDFVDLLNSFRAPFWTQVTLESELTVITLQRVPVNLH